MDDLTALQQIALEYCRRGWAPIPVPFGSKAPGKGWNTWRVDPDNVREYFPRAHLNIGVRLGSASHGLIDVDVDDAHARPFVEAFLPTTNSVFGRRSKPRSHWLYVCDPIVPTKRFEDVDGASLIEIRSNGGQTIFPPSIVDEEQRLWELDGDPTHIDGRVLERNVAHVAAGTLLARRWPDVGGRHAAALALAGGLLRSSWDEDTTRAFVLALCRAIGDEEEGNRLAGISSSVLRVGAGDSATGWPTLAQYVGADIVRRVCDWLQVMRRADRLSREDFWAYLPTRLYIHRTSGLVWQPKGIDDALAPVTTGEDDKGKPIVVKASDWLAHHRPVHAMTWSPGEGEIIVGRVLRETGWVEDPNIRVYNQYRAATLMRGGASFEPWLRLVQTLYPDDWQHIVSWFAHKVQRPAVKINHGLVLGGAPGIGKDTLLAGPVEAVGSGNYQEASPSQIMGRFNGFLRSVVLRVSEARDLGEVNRYAFYEHMKAYLASPPAVIRIDEKYRPEHYIPNVCGVVFTTNYRTGGMFLPPDDRRHYVAWSDAVVGETTELCAALWAWYPRGGYDAVATGLLAWEPTFDVYAPPPKTDAFWATAAADLNPEANALASAVERMGKPLWLTVRKVVAALTQPSRNGLVHIASQEENDLVQRLTDRRHSRSLPRLFEEVGYRYQRNSDRRDGRWRVDGAEVVLYVRADMTVDERACLKKELARGL